MAANPQKEGWKKRIDFDKRKSGSEGASSGYKDIMLMGQVVREAGVPPRPETGSRPRPGLSKKA